MNTNCKSESNTKPHQRYRTTSKRNMSKFSTKKISQRQNSYGSSMRNSPSRLSDPQLIDLPIVIRKMKIHKFTNKSDKKNMHTRCYLQEEYVVRHYSTTKTWTMRSSQKTYVFKESWVSSPNFLVYIHGSEKSWSNLTRIISTLS